MKNQKINKYSEIWGISSGLLLAAAFPPMPLFLLAFIAFIPLLYQLIEIYPKRKYNVIYLAFLVYHIGGNWWMGSWQEQTDPYLTASAIVLAFAHPIFFMLPFVPTFFVRQKMGKRAAIWSFPIFFATFEWLHSWGEFSYPWLTIGNTQIYNHYWIQFIDITGVWGSSLLILIINSLILNIIIDIKEKKERKKIIAPAIVIVLLLLLPIFYGIYKTKLFDHEKLLLTKKHINIGLIQPSINPWEKWSGGVYDQIKMHRIIQDSLTKTVGEIDLSIWSETAIPYSGMGLNSRHHYPGIRRWVDTSNTSLLTGFTEMLVFEDSTQKTVTAREFPDEPGKFYEPFNSAILLNPGLDWQETPQIYRKMRLTPFAERLPYVEYLMFAKSWFEWSVGISAWGRGFEQSVMTIEKGNDEAKIGTIICIESIYPEFVSNFTKLGAQVLTVITNDAWYDHTPGPEQHYQIAAIRAIENRRYIARVGNTGVTGFITPTGTSIQRAPQYKRIAIADTIPLLDYQSYYVKAGDWLMKIISIFSVLIILLSVVRQRKI